MGKLENKVSLITGAASGIGAATAKLFGDEGATVIVADIDEEDGRRIAEEIGASAVFHKANVGEPAEVESMVKFAVDRFGRLDILHNNVATAGAVAPVGDMPVESWQRAIAVSLSGVFYGMRYALPQMVAQGGGVIVNTASVSGLAADYMLGAYNAAKAGVINLTRTGAIEYARKNIRVNAVCPGSIATPPLLRALGEGEGRRLLEDHHPIGRLGLPEEIARVVLFLASDDSSFMTGSIVVADGGISAHTGLFGHPL
ncbi:MAG TPA: glucose 1-dehydrogenase [Candidatus Binataceae bacterium]|nr:glucose 1-dehydrogenase [Candidatus Binataceae bacterium]